MAEHAAPPKSPTAPSSLRHWSNNTTIHGRAMVREHRALEYPTKSEINSLHCEVMQVSLYTTAPAPSRPVQERFQNLYLGPKELYILTSHHRQ